MRVLVLFEHLVLFTQNYLKRRKCGDSVFPPGRAADLFIALLAVFFSSFVWLPLHHTSVRVGPFGPPRSSSLMTPQDLMHYWSQSMAVKWKMFFRTLPQSHKLFNNLLIRGFFALNIFSVKIHFQSWFWRTGPTEPVFKAAPSSLMFPFWSGMKEKMFFSTIDVSLKAVYSKCFYTEVLYYTQSAFSHRKVETSLCAERQAAQWLR